MKVLVISASPHKGANSDTLCDRFIKGAWERGDILGHHAMQEAYKAGKNL